MLDVNGRVGRIRKQPPLIRMNAFEHALAGKCSTFQDVERAGIEYLAAGVLNPDGA